VVRDVHNADLGLDLKDPNPMPGPVVIVTVVLLGSLALLLTFPPIGDVTTTPERPPRFRAEPPGDVEYPARFAGLQLRAYTDLAPLTVEGTVAETFRRAAEAARAMEGWRVVFEDDSLAVLQAVAETRLFRFKDDVVVEVRPADGGSEVHVRSRSRVGRTDFGTNARRIRAYLATLD
jgi:uncharacterized protein (DUF1499 family)